MTKNAKQQDAIAQLAKEIAALRASLGGPSTKAAPAPKAKAEAWETLRAVRVKGANGKTATELALCSFRGKTYVSLVRLASKDGGEERRVKGVALEAGALKAALAKLDI